MILRFLAALLLLPSLALAQSLPAPSLNGANIIVAPTGASSTQTASLAALAAQQGVLLDTFHQAGDADDTASLTRAVAAGVPILLGAKTYTVNNFSTGSVSSFVLRGVPGRSIVQRTSASGSQFFQISAASVVIEGVTFDMNKASVTANQWGVFLGAGGQNIAVRNSVFKNNSGSLGSCLNLISTGPAAGGSFTLADNEITGCTFNPLYLASVSNGEVRGNYVHGNSTTGMYVLPWSSASPTNYASNILIRANRFASNTGAGLSMGSFAPPYAYTNPGAMDVLIAENTFQDNSGYQLGMGNVDRIAVVGNILSQSSSGVTAFGGIDCNARYLLVEANQLNFPSASYGIDCGGAVETTIRNNHITMGASGAAIDIGGAVNSQVIDNHVTVSGTGTAVTVLDMETDGSLNPFPFHASNVAVDGNDIILNGTGTSGIMVLDNAGATSGTLPIIVTGNRFVGQSSATAAQDITYRTSGAGIVVQGNTHNGSNGVAVSLNGNTDYVFETVYDYVQGDSTAGSVRSIVNSYVNTYGGATRILWVNVTAGGSGYTWSGQPLIVSGVVVGVRTNGTGTGCSGATTIAATDAGGGSGATFTVAVTPVLPSRKTITYRSAATAGNVIQLSGGFIGIGGTPAPILAPSGAYVTLTANVSGVTWGLVSGLPRASYASGSLPTCSSTYSGVQVTVTGSGSGKWDARCNGTSWIYSDGTTAP
jgi:hypothetical protein